MTRRPILAPWSAVHHLTGQTRAAASQAVQDGHLDGYRVDVLPWWAGVRLTGWRDGHTVSADLATRLTRYPHAVRHAVHGVTLTLARRPRLTPERTPR